MKATIFVIPGSHPSLAGRLMLERKGIPYRRIDLAPAIHRLVVRAARFPGKSVPALRLDGRRLQGTREISRVLDELVPEPPLFPADPDRRAAVEEAERWGDDVLQSMPRRMIWWGMKRDRSKAASYLEGARLGVPIRVAGLTTGPIARLSSRFNDATDEAVRADLANLPEVLDHVDELIATGTIGGPEPNAADYQILTSVRLLLSFDEIRPLIEGRPLAEAARRVVPDFPGQTPPVFPAEWLYPLRQARSD